MSTTIQFVRHGEVDNPKDIYYGRLPYFHLSAKGVNQASAAASMLKRYKISAIYSSPLERAIETVKIIAKQLELPFQTSELLSEVYSPFDSQPTNVLEKRNWDVYTGSKPPFEQPTDVLNRVQKFILKVRKESRGKHVVAITHGDVIAFTVLWAKELPIASEQKQVLYKSFLTCASISSFTFETDLETEIPKFEYAK